MGKIVAWLCAGLLAGCTVGPNYRPPPPPGTPSWNNLRNRPDAAVTPLSDPDPAWWNGFNDKILTRLIAHAIAHNPTVGEAVLRVVESHQNVVTAAAAGLPTLSGNASYMREELGTKGILESDGAYSQLNRLADASSPLNQFAPGSGAAIAGAGTGALNQLAAPINLYQYGLSSTWELDLFGTVRRSVEAARASTQAQKEAANDAVVMLESEVAQTYFQMRGAQLLEQQYLQDVQVAQDSLQLTADRAARGLTTDLDVEQARTQLYSEQSQVVTYEKQAQQAIDQLDMLVGQPPGALDALLTTPAPLPAVPDVVGIGVPSSLARRRPDIREAEATLHAATANVGVAVASFYPDVSLMGSAGLRATDINFLTNWASLFYSFGPTISLPIFEGGRLVANLKTARARQEEAALNYRYTVLNALREVEDGLVAYRADQMAREQAANTVQAADLSYTLANSRYTHGLSNFIQVLDAERTQVSARQQLLQANEMLATDVVTLYTALGGGWTAVAGQLPKDDPPAAPPPLPAAVDSLAGGF